MYTYITAWLVCSITYNLNIDNKNSLPIDSIFYQNPTKKKLYIKAISDLIDRFNSNPAKKFFKTEESVQVIQKYLNELVYLIGQKTEKIQQDHVGNKQNLNIS